MVDVVEFSTKSSAIDGLAIITMKQVTDERGTVREFYRESSFAGNGLGPWKQVNVTETRPGAVRGMHGENMTKLVAVVTGEAFGAWVDARPASPTHGAVQMVSLVPGTQVLVPPGVCNGFQVLGDAAAQYMYCFDQEWVQGMAGVACTPLDPALGIEWPVPVDVDDPSIISTKDRGAPLFAAMGAL